MKEIKLYKSPWRAVKIIILCSAFVFIGIWLITSSDSNKWVGWIVTGFFGLGYPVGLFHLLDRRPQIIINEIGIWDRTIQQDIINWQIIQDAYLLDIHGQKFICLKLDQSYEPSNRKGVWYKRFAKLSKSLGFQEMNLSLGQLKIDEVRLNEFIQAMSNANFKQKKSSEKSEYKHKLK